MLLSLTKVKFAIRSKVYLIAGWGLAMVSGVPEVTMEKAVFASKLIAIVIIYMCRNGRLVCSNSRLL